MARILQQYDDTGARERTPLEASPNRNQQNETSEKQITRGGWHHLDMVVT